MSTPDISPYVAKRFKRVETPTPGTLVDVTRRTVWKTVEEEVVEYPEFPHGTVVEDPAGYVMQKGPESRWYEPGVMGSLPQSSLTWPVKVLRYGKG